jgi:hypothetical protein
MIASSIPKLTTMPMLMQLVVRMAVLVALLFDFWSAAIHSLTSFHHGPRSAQGTTQDAK